MLCGIDRVCVCVCVCVCVLLASVSSLWEFWEHGI